MLQKNYAYISLFQTKEIIAQLHKLCAIIIESTQKLHKEVSGSWAEAQADSPAEAAEADSGDPEVPA
jgi:hypothetical protein